jgi:hypothetical protein
MDPWGGTLQCGAVLLVLSLPMSVFGQMWLAVSLTKLRTDDQMPYGLFILGDRFQLWTDSFPKPHLASACGAVVAIGLGNLPAFILLVPTKPIGVELDALAFFLLEAGWTWWFVRLLRRVDRSRQPTNRQP